MIDNIRINSVKVPIYSENINFFFLFTLLRGESPKFRQVIRRESLSCDTITVSKLPKYLS